MTTDKKPLELPIGISVFWSTPLVLGLPESQFANFTVLALRQWSDASVPPVELAFGAGKFYIRHSRSTAGVNEWTAWTEK